MFDLDWSEVALTALVAVVVLGPKELPRAMHTAGKWFRRARMLAGDFQRHVDDIVREVELQELREKAQKLSQMNVSDEVRKVVDADGALARDLAETKETLSSSLGPVAGEVKAAEVSSVEKTVDVLSPKKDA